MCVAMSQYMPNTATISVVLRMVSGTLHHPGSPVWRSASRPARRSRSVRPLRCANTSANIAAVKTTAAIVPKTIWLISPPPAGGAAAAAKSKARMLIRCPAVPSRAFFPVAL
jgi:hypothetical protein